jgi:organic hydroperoxide reductase OsmC/OhrA
MTEHIAGISWKRTTPGFAYDEYNRRHSWAFDGGVTVPGAASPAFRGERDCVDPEEALVAAISSCHLLTFLAICARKRLIVDAYEDRAVGVMTKNAAGKLWVSRVDLHPKVMFAPGTAVDAAGLEKLHHASHVECFIANSVKTEIVVNSA